MQPRSTKICHCKTGKEIEPLNVKDNQQVQDIIRGKDLLFILIVTSFDFSSKDKKIAGKIVHPQLLLEPLFGRDPNSFSVCAVSGDDIVTSMDCVQNLTVDQVNYIVVSPHVRADCFQKTRLQMKANWKINISQEKILVKGLYMVFNVKTKMIMYYSKKEIESLDDGPTPIRISS